MDGELLIAGVIAGIAMIFLLLKMPLRRVCGYDVFVDIGFTGTLAYIFLGTYSGMIAALTGGALVSIFLFVVKKVKGAQRFSFRERRWVDVTD